MTFLEEEKVRLQEKVEKAMVAGEHPPESALTFTHERWLTWLLSGFQEKELVLELESMRTKYGVCGRERSPSRLDAFVKSLEEERDYFRQEAERYRRARGATSPSPSPSRSPNRGRSSWSNVRRVRKTGHLGGWR